MMPIDYNALKAQIVAHEGIRLTAYKDTKGILTIGVGRNLIAKGLSMPEAMTLLDHDLGEVLEGIHRYLPWTDQLDPMALRVLADIAFNCGVEGLLDFHKLLSALQRGDRDTAAAEVVNSTLAPGRARRLALMLTGKDIQEVQS